MKAYCILPVRAPVVYSWARMPKLAVVLIGAWIGVVASQPAELDTLLKRLDTYFTGYEPALSALVAREVMTQTIEVPSREAGSAPSRMPAAPATDRRRLESEIAFMALPGNIAWLGIRVVKKVDGKAVPSAVETISAVMQSDQPVALGNRILAESARHNLGALRNTNVPNLPLELLHPRHRHRFSYTVDGHAVISGIKVTILKATETTVPSIVHTPDGGELSTQVRAWLDDRGRVLRTEVRSRGPGSRGIQDEPVMRVEFKRHETLDLLVPVEMREEFATGVSGLLGLSVAKYSDFRRFETSARIVPQ